MMSICTLWEGVYMPNFSSLFHRPCLQGARKMARCLKAYRSMFVSTRKHANIPEQSLSSIFARPQEITQTPPKKLYNKPTRKHRKTPLERKTSPNPQNPTPTQSTREAHTRPKARVPTTRAQKPGPNKLERASA